MADSVDIASLGMGAARAIEPQARDFSLKGNLKQSVTRWTYGMLSLDELCQTVKQFGFSAIEAVGPADWPTLKVHGMNCPMCGGAELGLAKGFAVPQYHDELVTRYLEHIDLVADAGYRKMICFSGNQNGMDPEEGLANAEAGLKRVLGHAEKRGVVLAMELLNSKVDHPDYLCDNTAWGVALCERISSPSFALLYDIYHMQIMEGDIIATIRKYHTYFIHYHTAGVPGRHEIGADQELNYSAICRAIVETGFDGYLAHEFIPTAPDPVDSLLEAVRLCDV
nr:TIM barrel protein [Cephaloticoccus primus]